MGLFLSPCPPHFFEPPAPSKQREAIHFMDSSDSYQLRSEVTDGAFAHLLFFIALINYSMSWTQTDTLALLHLNLLLECLSRADRQSH